MEALRSGPIPRREGYGLSKQQKEWVDTMETAELPIWQIMEEFLQALREGKNVVIACPPGTGKTTQVWEVPDILDS